MLQTLKEASVERVLPKNLHEFVLKRLDDVVLFSFDSPIESSTPKSHLSNMLDQKLQMVDYILCLLVHEVQYVLNSCL